MGLAKGLVQQSTSSEVASVALALLHGLTIVPLILLPIMQDVHLKLGIVLNCTLLLCLMAGNLLFHWMGIVKVLPKMLDTFLLALYASMVPVAYLQTSWLQHWINVYHYGAVALFAWLTSVLPCWDSFATEALKDRLDDNAWGMPALRRAGLHISVVWGAVLSLCCVVTLVPALLPKNPAVHIACDYVAVMVLLVVGAAVQLRTTRRFLAAHASGQQLTDVELGDTDVGVSVVRLQPQRPGSGSAAQAAGVPEQASRQQAEAPAGLAEALRPVQDAAHEQATAATARTKGASRQQPATVSEEIGRDA